MNEPSNREEELFDAARQLSESDQRAAFLTGACVGDDGLRRRVEGLLAAQAKAEGLFRPLSPAPSSDSPLVAREEAGAQIGRYKLADKLGEGGMGVVYRAEQQEPVRRMVALKIIKLGMDTRQVVARFEAERQALALMDHPNIAKVLDGGMTGEGKSEVQSSESEGRAKSEGSPTSPPSHPKSEIRNQKSGIQPGRPYFVMELVEGLPITEFCERRQLSLDQRLRLFIPVCRAVQHAHQKGIIHRDLKPSNVMVTVPDGVPVPKVIDFGVAKAINQRLTEKTLFTKHATLIGTPAYMSPEQAEMSPAGAGDVDTRSDIYSLGVLLYELLTGTQPFPEKRLRSVAHAEMQRIILHEEPERPSTRLKRTLTLGSARGPRAIFGGSPKTLSVQVPAGAGDQAGRASGEPQTFRGELRTTVQALRGELDWIVLKCLEKDRNRRYETANGLAADLKRFLEHEPIVARPPTTAYRLRKLVRRHRAASVAVALISLAIVLGGIVAGWALIRERAARRVAAERLDAALAFVAQVLTNVAPGIQNLTGAARAQHDLGKATLGFARRLGAGAADDPTVRITLARALLLQSAAQNPGGANTVGEFEPGRELAQEAVRLLAEPIPQLPEPERWNLLLSARSAVVLCLYGLGDWEVGITRSEELEPLFDQLEKFPERPRWVRREPWNVRANVGYSLLLAGHPERAIERLRGLLRNDWFAQIGNDSPANEQELLANVHDNLAVALGLQNQFDAMLTNAVAGHRLWTNLVARHPLAARYQWGRIEGWFVLGWACMGVGRTNDGLALLEQSRIDSAVLVERDPANDEFRTVRAVAAGTRALSFATWGAAVGASPAERRERLNQAEHCLVEAEQLTSFAKSKEAGARLALARAGVEAIRRKVEATEPDDR